MLNDIIIYVQGYQWNSSVGQNYYKVNFFNINDDGQASYIAFTDKLDITPFIIADSIQPLTVGYDDIEKNGNQVDYFSVASDFNFKVSDIIKFRTTIYGNTAEYYLHDFFQIFEDTSYIKYMVEVYYKGTLAYTGFVNQDLIEEEISLTEDTKQISIQTLGMKKEFKNYFDNLKLKDIESRLTIYWQNMPYGIKWLGENGNDYQNPKYMSLDTLLRRIFNVTPATGFRCEIDVSNIKYKVNNSEYDWFVVQRPHIACFNGSNKSAWFHSGYQRAVDDNESCYSFLKKLCDAMGWTFEIYIKETALATKAYIILKNRYNVQSTNYTITNDKLLGEPSLNLRKLQNGARVSNAYLPNGTFDCSYSIWDNGTDTQHLKLIGDRCYVQSSSITGANKTDVADGFYYDNANNTHQPVTVVGHFGKYSKTDSELQLEYVRLRGDDIPSLTAFKYSVADCLQIDGGDSKTIMRMDMTTGTHTDGASPSSQGRDICWTGNYGGMLGYTTGEGTWWFNIYTYKDYTTGFSKFYPTIIDKTFENNIKTFILRKTNINPEVSVKDVIINPLRTVQFANETGYFAGRNFSIQEMSIDFVNDITTLKLLNLN